MYDPNGYKLKDTRLGVALAAFFGWLLTFPLFGYLLMETAKDNALALGLSFTLSHAAGLLLLHLMPGRAAAGRCTVWTAGGMIAGLTVVYPFLHRILIVDILLFSVLGLASAYFILAWASRFAGHNRPLLILAIAMAGANLVCAALNTPLTPPAEPLLALLAALVLGGVFLLQAECGADTPGETPRQNRPGSEKTVKALAAFIIAVYFIGGLWYHFFALELTAAPHWQATINYLIYAGAILLLAFLARRGQPGDLATYSLSALGVGLLIALTGSNRTLVVVPYQAALNLGLAAADLFLWYALWVLARYYRSRRVFGLGLGFCVLMIGFSVIISSLDIPGRAPAVHFITALTLVFLLVPFVFQNPFQLVNRPAEAGETTAGKSNFYIVPDLLTPMEVKVYRLLLQGLSDAEMAQQLYISKHTIKFHVRNILHKLEVNNRRELILRHLNRM